MSRYRWISAECPIAKRELTARIQARAFSREQPTGYVLDRVRETQITGRFIKYEDVEDSVKDPFGSEVRIRRMQLYETKFSILFEKKIIELVDPPRNVQEFLNDLSEICDYKLTISNFRINVLEWCRTLEESLSLRGKVISAQINDVAIDDGIFLKAIVKGERDTRNCALKLSRGMTAPFEKLKIQFDGDIKSSAVITNDACATVSGKNSDILTDAVRTSLLTFWSQLSLTGN